MKIIISHPTGNANVRAIVTAFAEERLLAQFFTTVACFEKTAWLKYLIKDVGRREFKNYLKSFTITHPWREIGRHAANRAGLYYFTKQENSIFSIDSVYQSLDKYVAGKIRKAPGASVIYGYEDGSYHSFVAAKESGFACVYDLPIAYWKTARRLMTEEAERLPAWKKTLGGGIHNSAEKLARKTAELEMADLVVAPSRFVANSVVEAMPSKKIIVSPFGTPCASAPGKVFSKTPGKLRVLFVGSLGQRKGLADLGKAVQLLNNHNVELVIMGSLLEDAAFYKKNLPAHTYIAPGPHDEVLKVMSSCDIFCLPSIVEGRALVMQEAMSRGLPIIITKNTGGEDLVTENTGFLVPVRSPEMIAGKINWFLEHRNQVKEMGAAAAMHAEACSWDAYTHNIIQTIMEQYGAADKP